jgi:DNA polymerase-3 subunit alpha
LTKKELWLQYSDKNSYLAQEQKLYELLGNSDGEDTVVIYCKAERAVKRLPANRNVHVDEVLLGKLSNYLGADCVKVIEKPIENKI